MLDKSSLRRQLLTVRKELSLSDWSARSAIIVTKIEAHCSSLSLNAVALYAPITSRREVDVSALDGWLRRRGVSVAYPIMLPGVRGFTLAPPELLAQSGGFQQPPRHSSLLQPGELDLLIVPALGVTPSGYRLGYGAGFYDEQLKKFCPPAISICVAFKEQLLNELPLEPHDVPCDGILTDA